ncbi:MAG TPA: hypothetical protein VGL94_11190 [Ktedonobacteraceae bacterium]|jgi:hypothetical protein
MKRTKVQHSFTLATSQVFRSAKKTRSESEAREGEIIERPKKYTIDAEIGRLAIPTFEIKEGSQEVFSAQRDVFPETGSREHYPTPCFRELVVFSPCDDTFRKSEHEINRVLWRQEKMDRVQSNMVEREGKLLQEQIGKKAEQILQSHGFNPAGKLIDEKRAFEPIAPDSFLPHETVSTMIEELNSEKEKKWHIDVSELHVHV